MLTESRVTHQNSTVEQENPPQGHANATTNNSHVGQTERSGRQEALTQRRSTSRQLVDKQQIDLMIDFVGNCEESYVLAEAGARLKSGE